MSDDPLDYPCGECGTTDRTCPAPCNRAAAELEAARKRIAEWEAAFAKQACDFAEYKVRAERAEALLREARDTGGLANDLVRDRIDAYLKGE